MHPAVLAPHLAPARAPIDEPTCVRLVLQHPSDPDRVPASAVERRDAVPDQLGADAVEAPKLSEAREDAPYDLSLEWLHIPLTGGRVVHVAIASSPERLGHS